MNLILSVVQGMEYEKVATFLESFAATSSGTEMHLFVCGVSPESVKKMEQHGVTIHPFRYLSFRRRQPLLALWPLWRWMLARRDFAGKCALGKKVFHLFATRFILYYEFLQAHRGKYENVLLTDCRDVMFQRDAFSDHMGPGVHCFLEARSQLIGECSSNSRMIAAAAGPGALAEFGKCRVSCAGTTMGDAESIMGYLKATVEAQSAAPDMFGGSDQGIHNLLVHRNMVPSLHVHDNYDSSVFTAGCEPAEAIRWNAEDEIIRDDGKPYPVLHQYDRDPAMKERLLEKLRRRMSAAGSV